MRHVPASGAEVHATLWAILSSQVAPVLTLILGLALFFAPHLLRDSGRRDAIINALPSMNAYRGLYSVVALAGLGLIIWGKAIAPFSMVWEPIFELRFISHVLMIPAVVLVLAGNLPMSYLRQQLRNPMLLGVTFWGVAHLWSNGDLASMLLFGSFALWGAFKFIALGISQGAVSKKPSILWDIIAVVAGLFLYVLVSVYHGELFGVGLSFD